MPARCNRGFYCRSYCLFYKITTRCNLFCLFGLFLQLYMFRTQSASIIRSTFLQNLIVKINHINRISCISLVFYKISITRSNNRPIKVTLFWPRYESERVTGAGHYAWTSRRIEEAGKTTNTMAWQHQGSHRPAFGCFNPLAPEFPFKF